MKKIFRKIIPMIDRNVEILLKARINNDLSEELNNALQNSKCGIIHVKHAITGKTHYGITAAFGEGVGCYMSNEDEWFTTSTIKKINWEEEYFETLNSKYFFDFEELDFQELYNAVFGYMNNITVKVKKLNENAVIPKYMSAGAACVDITATSIEYDSKMNRFIYHTGLAFEVPKGYYMDIRPRSNMTKKRCAIVNANGTLDSDYRGELIIVITNLDVDNHVQPYDVGDRICQIMILPYPTIEFVEVDELSNTTRGEGGFGSTNK